MACSNATCLNFSTLKYFYLGGSIMVFLTFHYSPNLKVHLVQVSLYTGLFRLKPSCLSVLSLFPYLAFCLVCRLCAGVCMRAQLCPTLCDPLDCSLPGSSVHGILQARIL